MRTGSWSVLGMVAFYAAALAGAPRRCWSATTLVPLAWLVLAFERVGHAPFFAIAATLAVAELLPRVR